jgi:EAL domain-containing protein (putative c-di-GMP-specific phosphodiesterase class I)
MASPYQLASRVGSSEVYAGSVVAQMTSSRRDTVIVRSTVDLGRNLGLRVVAKGVEDHATWQQLHALGCDAIQD